MQIVIFLLLKNFILNKIKITLVLSSQLKVFILYILLGLVATISRHGNIRNFEDVPTIAIPRSHSNGNLQRSEFRSSSREGHTNLYLDAWLAL